MGAVYDRQFGMSDLSAETKAWLEANGFSVQNEQVWLEALTHGSFNSSVIGTNGDKPEADYQRLEFLGDRVLGLSVASWLYKASTSHEGQLSQRLNALVSGATCAQIAREIGLPKHIRLGKQARDDGGADSDNILGDVMEAIIGASFIEAGYDETRTLIHQFWESYLSGDAGKVKHPKSALQEWAAGNKKAMPRYEVIERSGPDHASRFTVRVSVHMVGEAEAIASSKSEAEKHAAKAFLEKFS